MYRTWNASFLEALSRWGQLTGQANRWTLHLNQPKDWLSVARLLRQEGEVECFLLLTATHVPPYFQLRYDLRSLLRLTDITIYFRTPVEEPVPSVASVWPAADWQEREAYDLVGVLFAEHPNLKRILLPQDWPGHPLQEGYSFPPTYRDIPLSYTPSDASV
jgi:NADH:ubiquinone oxidoreductase subunit C